jgi:transposase
LYDLDEPFAAYQPSHKAEFWFSANMSQYDLTDFEWRVIKPLLPNKPRGVRRVDERRVLNGIFWVLRSGAPWRDLPERYGPRTTCSSTLVHAPIVLADKAYDADRIRELIQGQGATPNISPKRNRRWKPCFSKRLYRERNLIERFFFKLKHYRRIATRYDKLAANSLAMVQLASIRLWLRAYEYGLGRRPSAVFVGARRWN